MKTMSNGINLDNKTIEIIEAYIEDFERRRGLEERIPKNSGLEHLCVHELKRIMAEYIGLPKVELKIKGHEFVEQKPYNNRNYDVYFHNDKPFRFDWYALHDGRTQKSKVKAHTFFNSNANRMCQTYIKQRYGNIDNAFMAHIFFVDLKHDYLIWFDDRREQVKNKLVKVEKDKNIAAYKHKPYGAVANLLKTLTKTMEIQGADIRSIAKMQWCVCKQAGVMLPDEFITDVATALDIDGELDVAQD